MYSVYTVNSRYIEVQGTCILFRYNRVFVISGFDITGVDCTINCCFVLLVADDRVKYLDMEQKITKRNLKTVRKKTRTSKLIYI